MKKRNCAIVFAAIFIIFALPPLLISPASRGASDAPASDTSVSYPVTIFFHACFFACLMYLNVCVLAGSLRSGWLELRKRMEVKKSRFVLDSGAALVTFGLLCCIFALMQLALFLGFFPESRHVFYRPDSVGGWIYCLLGLFAAAFNEEALYRSILPFWASAGFAPRFRPVWECALVVSFALGHRYLGPQACLNAALAGAALRVCAIKRKSILPSFVAHSAYNLFLLVLETIL